MRDQIELDNQDLKESYWKGFEDGKRNSLKHNILLMKSQLKVQKEFITKQKIKIKRRKVVKTRW